MGDILPINAPARTELWSRVQLARSVLGHRPYTAETAALLSRILNGEEIADLMHPAGGAA